VLGLIVGEGAQLEGQKRLVSHPDCGPRDCSSQATIHPNNKLAKDGAGIRIAGPNLHDNLLIPLKL
jgi:hypothetical protein